MLLPAMPIYLCAIRQITASLFFQRGVLQVCYAYCNARTDDWRWCLKCWSGLLVANAFVLSKERIVLVNASTSSWVVSSSYDPGRAVKRSVFYVSLSPNP
ncbi:hypothetical protein FOIG_07242 [Fusarium odoratissimum NRRL 54006]|uniref:Uncharacterized protein n=1 Tax=Fusarium odoratissimum (strain NRRL 54006) TaxID=1089451 RepID=X0KYE3_FUSO5|nr:uncharacterized protein FOIG_07242 [Fusarium odoratissimum NRRL 54006]EXM01735.1 hypothetical protein FOIG_07242 [Fusarium odoratissimum NRRL 54006]